MHFPHSLSAWWLLWTYGLGFIRLQWIVPIKLDIASLKSEEGKTTLTSKKNTKMKSVILTN